MQVEKYFGPTYGTSGATLTRYSEGRAETTAAPNGEPCIICGQPAPMAELHTVDGTVKHYPLCGHHSLSELNQRPGGTRFRRIGPARQPTPERYGIEAQRHGQQECFLCGKPALPRELHAPDGTILWEPCCTSHTLSEINDVMQIFGLASFLAPEDAGNQGPTARSPKPAEAKPAEAKPDPSRRRASPINALTLSDKDFRAQYGDPPAQRQHQFGT
ncbi:MAG: hypothetical protein NTY19_26075 [Planctomycetota bacterium]|nr:hypothetical protein [Planctomycetota bacterium]